MFENLVNYDKSKTMKKQKESMIEFENLVNYDKSKTSTPADEQKRIV